MYAPTSTNSPRSGPTSGDNDALTDFDGVGEILRAWGNGLRPDPDLTVSEWADRHRMLSGRASAEPGKGIFSTFAPCPRHKREPPSTSSPVSTSYRSQKIIAVFSTHGVIRTVDQSARASMSP